MMRSLVIYVSIVCLMCPAASGQSYNIKVHLRNGETVAIPIDEIRHVVFSQTTEVPDPAAGEQTPFAFQLLQNYPNPFNPSTTIVYETAKLSDVAVRIFDLKGALVRDLFNEAQAAGRHTVQWDGTDNTRTQVSSGVYFSVVQCDGQILSRRLILLK